MDDLKKQRIEVADLAVGMFVTELDIPWIESPFLLQGFLIEDNEAIIALQSACKIVWLDRTKSAGVQFIASKKHEKAIVREGAVIRLRTASKQPNNAATEKAKKQSMQTTKLSFFEILRELKNNANPQLPPNYIAYAAIDTYQDSNTPSSLPDSDANALSIAQHLKNSIGNTFNLVMGFFSAKEKLNDSIDWNGEDEPPEIAGEHGYRITIFEEEPEVEDEIATIYPVYEKSQIAIRDLFNGIANAQNLDLSHVSEVVDSMANSIQRDPDALMWLAKLKRTDNYAYNHALNVSINLMAFSSFLSLPRKQIKELGMAGLLQDIGKINIPADILLSPNKLDADDLQIARSHVDEGLSILENTKDIPSAVIYLVAQHHERIDGSGYPFQLSGKQLGLQSQIAGLIDTYCAITTNKPYAKGLFNQQALEKIHAMSGQQFSNTIVDQLVQFLGIYPVSSLVELNTGEVAVVIQQNQVRRLLPRLMILLAPDKTRNGHPAIINLINTPLTPNGEPYTISRGVEPDAYGLNPEDFYA